MTALVNANNTDDLKREIKEVLRSMDFVCKRHLNRNRISKRDMDAYHRIYQKLALAWEYLGLRCKHTEGYRRIAGKKQACRICGKVKDVADQFILLSANEPKRIGHMKRPTSKKTFPNAKAASVLDDSIKFHGAKLRVNVHNSYKSGFARCISDITIADERIVNLQESNVMCSIDDHLVHVKLPVPRKRGQVYGGFVWELKRETLKRFPVIMEYDDRGNLLGLEILRAHYRGGLGRGGHKS